MRTTIKSLTAGCAAFFLVAALPARADVTLVTESSDSAKKKEATIYFAPNRLRAESEERGSPAVMIFDGAAKKMSVLHPAQKTYMEMSEASMALIRNQGGHGGPAGQSAMDNPQVKAALEARMATMPPEQRARMQAMMAQRPGSTGGAGAGAPEGTAVPVKERKLAFTNLGVKKTINGFACEMYRVTEDGQPYEEDCITPFGPTTFTREDVAAFHKVSESMMAMMGHMTPIHFGSFHTYPGVPVERKKTSPAAGARVDTIKSIKHDSLAASLFTVPAGYTLEQKQGMMMGGPPR